MFFFLLFLLVFFFFNDTATTEIYTLSLHDALPILHRPPCRPGIHRAPREQRSLHYPERWRRRSAPRRPRPCRTRDKSYSLASCSYAPLCSISTNAAVSHIQVFGQRTAASAPSHIISGAAILQRTMNRLRGGALIPRGVYRFRDHEEADEWMIRTIAATHAHLSSLSGNGPRGSAALCRIEALFA